MEKQKKSAMVGIPVIILAFSTMFLSASPCFALEVSGETTIDYPIYGDVAVKSGGTLNLLYGGAINGAVGVESYGTLNIEGGQVNGDVFVNGDSEVNIKGGDIEGDIYPWDITVGAQANLTVFGTDFEVTNGMIDSSGTYFTPDKGSICSLTGEFGGGAGDIDLLFYVYFSDIHIFLAPPDPGVIEVLIDIKPGSEQNSINLKSKGVVPVAVLTTDSICAEMINPSTVVFAGAAPQNWSFEDVDDDGKDDIIFHFRTHELGLGPNSTEATLTAQLLTGEEISGTDEVRIVPSKKK